MEPKAHPADSKRMSYKLPLGVAVFTLVLIIGYFTMPKPLYEYQISNQEMLEVIKSRNAVINPAKADSLLKNFPGRYRLVDLRNPHEFIKGHLEGAINIPSHNILDEAYVDLLNEPGVVNIFYSNNHPEACPTWMLMHEVGNSNSLMLLGGYDSLKDLDMSTADYPRDEAAEYDFAELMKKLTGGKAVAPSTESAMPAMPIAKKKKKAASGGC